MGSDNKEIISNITYRIYQDTDKKGLLELWKECSGWGGITAEQFDDWHIHTPYGSCLIVVAENREEQIVGQLIFVPSVVYNNGKDNKSYRVMAPIVNHTIRGINIEEFNHPTYAMLRFGMEQAKSNGYSVIYAFPSIGWLKMFKTFPKYGLPQVSVQVHNCLQIDIKVDTPIKPCNNYYIQLAHFNEEYDQLWKDAVNSLPITCAVTRHAKWLMWKRSGHIAFEMRHAVNHQLSGFIIIKRSGLVVDFLAKTIDEMQLVLQLTIQQLRQNTIEQQGIRFRWIKLMQTQILDEVLHNVPHHQVEFRFAFIHFSADEQLQENKEWFIMPDD